MFAVFLQKQEQDTTNSSGTAEPDGLENEFGHFCAPLCPGFCEANQCIFHTNQDLEN